MLWQVLWEALTGSQAQRLVCLVALSLALTAGGIEWHTTLFWCIFVLIIVLDWISQMDGRQKGTADLLSMPKGKLIRLKDFMDSVESGSIRSQEELDAILKKEHHDDADQ